MKRMTTRAKKMRRILMMMKKNKHNGMKEMR
jgi:hypothetical protein